MWFLFIIRTKSGIARDVISAEEYSVAFDMIKDIYASTWGITTWLVSCYQCETEPKEL